MKKILILLTVAICALTLVLSFSCCSSGAGESETLGITEESKVSDIVTAITNEYPMSDSMIQVTDETTISDTLGIEKTNYSDIAVYINNSGVEQDELIIVKATNENAANSVAEFLQNRLDSKLNSTKNYLPEQYEIVNKCEVTQNGDYVALIVSENADEMNKILDEQLK